MPLLQHVGQISGLPSIELQELVNTFKDTCNEATFCHEMKKLLQSDKEQESSIMPYKSDDFDDRSHYLSWKSTEERQLSTLLEKYTSKRTIHQQVYAEQNIIPKANPTEYFIQTAESCLKYDHQNGSSLLSKKSQELLELCCKLWGISHFAKASCLFSAVSNYTSSLHNGDDQSMFDEQMIADFFNYLGSQNALEDQITWPSMIKQQWITSLSVTYNGIMREIRDGLTRIYNELKPKFTPLLVVLQKVESDRLFEEIKSNGLCDKWERKLTRALRKIAEARYVELLAKIPTDDSLDLEHVAEWATQVTEDARLLTNRYKNPLLGFLYIPQTCAGLSTAMAAIDCKNMLLHIQGYRKNLNYGETLLVYKALTEIRSIFEQVNPPDKQFKFDLEAFFYPYLEEWCEYSGNKIIEYINQAIKEDKFEALDIENDKLYSSSIVDIFTMINQSFTILKDTNWSDQEQSARLVTKLAKFVSTGLINYSNALMEMMLSSLDEQTDDITEDQSLLNNTTEWFKNTISGKTNRVAPPQAFDFDAKTCVAMNNLDALLTNIHKLEDVIDPEKVAALMTMTTSQKGQRPSSHLFSIRILGAENVKRFTNSSRLPDTYVSVVDGANKKRLFKTRIVKNNINPQWDEEFEVVLPPTGSDAILGVTIWDCSSRLGQQNVCGRTVINLQPSRFNMDGLPQQFELDFDTQGQLSLEISMESEREDVVFCIGRAHRAITRIIDRCVKLIVEKFLTFLEFSISKNTLKLICGKHGHNRPSVDLTRTALEPLFDYLNSNFQILATNLSDKLLLKIIAQTWIIVLNTADDLLLPKLSSAKMSITMSALSSQNKRLSSASWQNLVPNAINAGNFSSVQGFGRPLTHIEVEVVFEWLKVLCFEFFHNNGAGPPIEELKNEKYQELLLIPVYYDRDSADLKKEVDRFSPATLKMITEKHFYSIGASLNKTKTRSRAATMARKNTIAASGSARQRAIAAKEYQEAKSDPMAAQAAAENILLRILLLKNSQLFVAQRLEQRERFSKSIAAELFARLAAEGTL